MDFSSVTSLATPVLSFVLDNGSSAGAWASEFFDYILVVFGLLLVLVGALGGVLAGFVPTLALLSNSIVQRAVLTVGIVLALVGGFAIWLTKHDAEKEAQWKAVQVAAVSSALTDAAARANIAQENAVNAAKQQAAAEAPVRKVIEHVPVQTTCATSPAVGAALDEVRRSAPGARGSGATKAAPASQ